MADDVALELPDTAVQWEPATQAPARRRLGEMLIEAGLITPTQLTEALSYGRAHEVRLGTALVNLGFLAETDLESSLARQLGVEVCDVESINPSPEVLRLIPEETMRTYEVVPLALNGETLVLGMVNPNDFDAVDAVLFATGIANLERRLMTQTTLQRFLATRYSAAVMAGDLVRASQGDEGSAVIAFVDYILAQAVSQRASDIHLEPYEGFFRVRFRVDGCLYTALSPPPRLHQPMVSRIKILAGMDISEKRKPQDGHIQAPSGRETIHYRVSTLPTSAGEKCVLRLLKKEAHLSDLGRLGLSAGQLADIRRTARLSQGLVLFTGPTGSGKTTTVHAAINYINDPEVNIVTIEDPVEQTIPGVNHVQVQDKGGVSFPSALRSILRQDPDVVFVGEMRDPEVASIAVRASLTGHLVFSTLHTNGILETFARLTDVGVEPYLLASSLQLVVAQRLVRRLCARCTRIEAIPGLVQEEFMLTEAQVASALHRVPVGCPHSLGTGYRGRIAIYEVLCPRRDLREMLRKGADEAEMGKAMRSQGMVGLWDAGVARALAGETAFDEVRRVLPPPEF